MQESMFILLSKYMKYSLRIDVILKNLINLLIQYGSLMRPLENQIWGCKMKKHIDHIVF